MAEGTTLHNLLQSQMNEGKIGINEAASRKTAYNTTKMFIKSASKKPSPGITEIMGRDADKSIKNIKAARKLDGK